MGYQVFVVGFVVFLLAACGKPGDAIIPPEASKYDQIKAKVDQLPSDEREALMRYFVRLKPTMPGGAFRDMPPGTTIRQAIDAQRAHEAEVQSKESAAKALKEKLEREDADSRRALEQAVQVVLVSMNHVMKDIHASRFSDQMRMRLGFENKSGKEVAGVQGVAIFQDMFGNEVQRVNIAYSRGLSVGAAITWDGSVELNQFSDRDKAFASLETPSAKFKFEPNMVVFKDGSSIKARP